jgi:hypothetical protein
VEDSVWTLTAIVVAASRRKIESVEKDDRRGSAGELRRRLSWLFAGGQLVVAFDVAGYGAASVGFSLLGSLAFDAFEFSGSAGVAPGAFGAGELAVGHGVIALEVNVDLVAVRHVGEMVA